MGTRTSITPQIDTCVMKMSREILTRKKIKHLDSHAIRTSRTKILSKFKMELDQFMVGLHYVISYNC